MQSGRNKVKAKRQLVYKPYVKGRWFTGRTALKGLKLLAYYGAFTVAYLLMGSVLQFDSLALRLIINLFVVTVCALILFNAGARDGEGEVSQGEIAYAHQQAGKTVSQKDLDRCYHPMKGWFAFLCAAAVLLLITIPHALTAEKQTYALQTLPGWVSSFQAHEEISAPLAYYQQDYTFSFLGILHVLVRLLIYPFVSMVGTGSADAMLTLDRFSPLVSLVTALGYPIGYLTGPRARAMVHGDIRANYHRRQRREKKARQARQEKKNELI